MRRAPPAGTDRKTKPLRKLDKPLEAEDPCEADREGRSLKVIQKSFEWRRPNLRWAAVAVVVGGLAVLATERLAGGRVPDCDAGRVRDALVDLVRKERDLEIREIVGIETVSHGDGETLCRARLLHGEGDTRIGYHVDRQAGRPVVRITEWQPP